MVLRHGPQCICQLCTCGRHHCPFDRNSSTIQLGNSTESPFQRKSNEYASTGAERVKPIRPVSDHIGHALMGSGRNQHDQMTSSYNEDYRRAAANGVARQRRRSGGDQFDALATGENDENLQVGSARVERAARGRGRSPYRPPTSDHWKTSGPFEQQSTTQADYKAVKGDRYETKKLTDSNVLKSDSKFDSKSATQQDYVEHDVQRRRSTHKPTPNEVWAQKGGKFESVSVNQRDFTPKTGERYNIERPADSEILKQDGKFDASTVNASDYVEHDVQRRRSTHKPTVNEVWAQKGGEFESKTVNQRDFTPKTGERYEVRKAQDSDVLKGEGKFDASTVNASDYVEHDVQRRRSTHKPTVNDVWEKNKKFEGESINRTDYSHKVGERYDAKRPQSSNVLKSDSKFDASTVNASDYVEHPVQARSPQNKQTLEEVWASRGPFEGESINRTDYSHKVGERYDTHKPTVDQVWAQKGAKFEGESINRTDYSHKVGEKYDAKLPQDSDVLKGEGRFEGKSATQQDYVEHDVQRRRSTHKPTVDQIWAQKGGEFEGQSVSKRDYDAKIADRYEVRKPVDSDVLKGEGRFDGKSVSQQDYDAKTADRYEVRKPQDNEIFAKDGMSSFAHRMGEKQPPQAVKGERFEARRPRTSDIWKKTGTFDAKSSTQTDYVAHDGGERAQIVQRPQDSNVLKSDGRFQAQSTSAAAYKPGQAVRFDVERPGSSDLWKTEGKTFEEKRSVTQTDYSLGDDAFHAITAHHEAIPRTEESTDLWKTDQPMEGHSVSQTDYALGDDAFHAITVHHGVIPRADESTDLWKTDQPMEGHSVSQTDYALGDDAFHAITVHHGIIPRADESTDLWKTNQPMEGHSVSQSDYMGKFGERAQATARAKSQFLLGSDTASRPDAFQSVSQHDYAGYERAERSTEVRPHGELQVSHEGTLDGKSVYQENYQVPNIALRSKAVRPSTALKLSGEHELESGYQKEFTNIPDHPNRCLAGELVDGIKHNLRKTPHFKLRDVHHAHYFFEPRTGDSTTTSSDSAPSTKPNTADSQKTLT